MNNGRYLSETTEFWQLALMRDLFPGDLIIEIALFFLGSPYRAGTLEAPGTEKLIINLNEFDCTTFVETVLALAGCSRTGKLSLSEFHKNLKWIRYRAGKIDGYTSRLHYFTDWITDNEKKKVLKNISRRLIGKPVRKKINFMTTHRNLYPALKRKTAWEKMQGIERRLSGRTYYRIGKDKITAIQDQIQAGDIIAFAADQQGLDVEHVGFAVRRGRHLHLLHASRKDGAVVISREALPKYLKANKKFTGIYIARVS